MHDNTLVAARRAKANDALLIPTYTPIRTDESTSARSVSFSAALTSYLQQKSASSATPPWILDRLLDGPRLLRWISRSRSRRRPRQLAT